jgi:transcription elongation factor Elf1
VSDAPTLSRERAERIARAHACANCGESNYRKVQVKPSTPALRAELKVTWLATLVCGVCDMHQELGIDDDGDVVYVG